MDEAISVYETFAATDDAPARARALVSRVLDHDPRTPAAQLGTSELVTNAIVHGGISSEEEVEVHVTRAGTVIRISVSNRGAGFDATGVRSVGAPGGWGLTIVANDAAAWGAGTAGSRTVVWFEL